MTDGAFPIIYSRDVARATAFYGQLGFAKRYQFPPDGEAGYVTLARGTSTLGIVDHGSPRELIGLERGAGPCFELFVYVDDVDVRVEELRASGVPVLREPADMPWGERVAFVRDPDGNPVTLAAGSG